MCVWVEVTAGTPEEGAQEDRASQRIKNLGVSGASDTSPHQPQRQGEHGAGHFLTPALVSFTKLRPGLILPSSGFLCHLAFSFLRAPWALAQLLHLVMDLREPLLAALQTQVGAAHAHIWGVNKERPASPT